MVELPKENESVAWNAYYDALETMDSDDGALNARAREILEGCRVATDEG